MIDLTRLRYDCLAGYSRSPILNLLVEEVRWVATDDERVLGLVARHREDNDFGWAALGRDERLRYRAVDARAGLPTLEAANASLEAALERLADAPDEEFHQGDVEGPPVDFFRQVVPDDRLSPTFQLLAEAPRYAPAREAVTAMMRYHEDADGNFVQQFQSRGFDARLWELYLFATMTELGYARVGDQAVPDFVLGSPFGSLAMEAVTANPPVNVAVPTPANEAEFFDYLHNYIPIKLARALTRKLRRDPPYWQIPEVRDLPFVLAIQDFHAPGVMRMIVPAATEYAFGVRHWRENDGVRIERLVDHRYDGLIEPSGFFSLEASENVSAILLNPQGTITKFNRMGYLAGFGPRNIRMLRTGAARGEHNPENPAPQPFAHEVHAPGYRESWVEGMVVLHNPHARQPLDPDRLPGAAHEFLQDDGRIMSLIPEFHPVFSQTQIFLDNAA